MKENLLKAKKRKIGAKKAAKEQKKIEKTFAPANASAALAASVESVIMRTKDFARSPTVRKQLKGVFIG